MATNVSPVGTTVEAESAGHRIGGWGIRTRMIRRARTAHNPVDRSRSREAAPGRLALLDAVAEPALGGRCRRSAPPLVRRCLIRHSQVVDQTMGPGPENGTHAQRRIEG